MITAAKSRMLITQELIKILEETKSGDLLALAKLLYQRQLRPLAFVTVCGETSTGKSSLINGLFRRSLLPVSAAPTTAAVTHVDCCDDGEERFFAVSRSAEEEIIDQNQFERLSTSPVKDLLRLRVQACPSEGKFIDLQVFDTPGYNAIIVEHEEVLKEFLPQSDVVVFVTGYRTGFGLEDQDLLETVRLATEDDKDIPIFLAVNRVPAAAGTEDCRVKEIVSHARDCLHREPRLVLVRSATEFQPDENSLPPSRKIVPDAGVLWDEVADKVNSQERRYLVDKKLNQLLNELIKEADRVAEREEIGLLAKEDELRDIEKQIEEIKLARDKSLKAISQTTKVLASLAPRTICQAAEELEGKIKTDIYESSKWFGAEECAWWLEGHALPFAARAAAKAVEKVVVVELEKLDRELNEIANTAVKNIQKEVQVKSDAVQRFAANLTKTVLERVGGSVIHSILLRFGGVGGVAAGAGNLAKMAVSNLGKIVGKTFGRAVYTSIGRTFTKAFIQKLTIATQIIIELVIYLKHVQTWQKEMEEKTREAITKWKNDVLEDFVKNQLPSIRSANEKGVVSIYDDLMSDKTSDHAQGQKNAAVAQKAISERRIQLHKMKEKLQAAGF